MKIRTFPRLFPTVTQRSDSSFDLKPDHSYNKQIFTHCEVLIYISFITREKRNLDNALSAWGGHVPLGWTSSDRVKRWETPLVYTLNGVGTSYHGLSYRRSQRGHVTTWTRQRQASLKNCLLRTVKNDAILKETYVCCGKIQIFFL